MRDRLVGGGDDIAVFGLDAEREAVVLRESARAWRVLRESAHACAVVLSGCQRHMSSRVAGPAAEGDEADLQVAGDCAQVREPVQVGPPVCRVGVGGVEGAGDRGEGDTGLVGGRPDGVHDVIRYGLRPGWWAGRPRTD